MLNIINELGVTENVSVVRFFKANNANYLMYTLNEKDEAGYIKLFAAKMLDAATFSKIEDEEEWASLKELIKLIVKEAKENALVSAEDLDFVKLNGIKVLGTRVFKLTEQVTEVLGSNKKKFVVETPTVVEQPNVIETPFVVEPTVVNAEEVEAQSFEELLAQSAPKLEELVFEMPKTVEQSVVTPVVEQPVVTPIVETPTAPTMEPTKKLSTLEELLGQYTEESVVTPVVASPIVEEVKATTSSESETIKNLEAKVMELEAKLAKIKEILQ